ncbi:MAG TPA: hypothetical protein VMW49_07060 [Candidatus Dormibacteraeota bacterium]|nr:hypothetical protein [Candidatus Dormibacteraeota bacterium]
MATRRRRRRRRHPPPLRHRRLLFGALVAALLATGSVALVRIAKPPAPSTCDVTSASGETYSLSPIQAQNASIIAAVAYQRQLPDHAVTVALAAALQESRLVDLDHGDRDSLGLFQQRPSQGWGTPAQIMDPDYAATAFYNRLTGVPGWETLAVGQVAQAVQLSAVPGAYAPWESEARALARALTGEVPAGLSCRLSAWGGPAPPSGALSAAAQTEFGTAVLGQTLAAKTGWEVASWAVAHAFQYHLQGVAFGGESWDSAAGVWRPSAAGGTEVIVRS